MRLQSPSQITIFPESIHKLNIDKKQTIEEFIASHPEVEKWAPWTTNEERRIAAENRVKQASDAVNFSVNDAKGKGKKNTAVTESTDQFSADASSGSLVQSAHHSPTATLSVPSDHAKLDNKTQKIKKNIRKFKNGDAHIKTNGGIKTTLNDLRKFFGMDYKGNSNYVTFNTPYGTMTLRIAEHNAKGDNFARDNSAMNVSVYIARNEYEQPESSVPFDEYRISEEDFNNNKEDFVKSLIESVDDALTTGEFTQPRHTEKVVEDGAKLWNMANAQAKANAEAVEAKRVEAIKETAQRWSKKLGAKVLEQMIKDARKDGAMAVAKAASITERIKEWIKDMFAALKETLSVWSKQDLADLSIEDFNNLTLRDLAEGVNPNEFETEEGDVQFMGSRVNKRMADISNYFNGRTLSAEQLYSGKSNNKTISVNRAEGKANVVMRQGVEIKAGTKHSLLRHYNTNVGVITAEDITLIPDILANGERVKKQHGNTTLYEYKQTINGVKYTVQTEVNNRGAEIFDDYYTDRSKVARSSNTQLSAQADSNLASQREVTQNSANSNSISANQDISFSIVDAVEEGQDVSFSVNDNSQRE